MTEQITQQEPNDLDANQNPLLEFSLKAGESFLESKNICNEVVPLKQHPTQLIQKQRYQGENHFSFRRDWRSIVELDCIGAIANVKKQIKLNITSAALPTTSCPYCVEAEGESCDNKLLASTGDIWIKNEQGCCSTDTYPIEAPSLTKQKVRASYSIISQSHLVYRHRRNGLPSANHLALRT